MDLAVGARKVLSHRLSAAIADAEKEIAIFEYKARAEVRASACMKFAGDVEDLLVVNPFPVADAAAGDAGHACFVAVLSGSDILAVSKIDPPVFLVVRVLLNFEQAALAMLPDFWRAFDRFATT